MPSFLSRLLGRKKPLESEQSADNTGNPTPLLEGKFEAVSPTVSPSAALFTDPGVAQIRGNDKPKDKESPFNLFRPRSRPSSDLPTVEKAAPDLPHLSLNLPVTKVRGRTLDVVFESDPDAFALLNEATIGERRLTPHEALSLVRACSRIIVERGLETLGIMHPHWHSASPEVQRRLISLFLLSLASLSPNNVTSPTSPTAPATFESELRYTRSPHDVAAVLRWGLRHLKLDGDSFGKESGDWTWYDTFTEAERTGSYQLDAFSKSLIPLLPTAHTELLLTMLDTISSLSACCEANGSSGSKLSKFFGLWLLTSEPSVEGDDWNVFYNRWDRAGRILEHLFLARIRDDAGTLPRRLTDLVEHYPYDYAGDAPKDNLLPRPRFSTRQYDALFVRLDTEYSGASKPKSHPLRLIADALRAQSTNGSATTEYDGLWGAIQKASLTFDASEAFSDATPVEPIPIFSNVFCDETIRLLSFIPVDVSDMDKSVPTFALQSPISPGRPRSCSLPETPLSPVEADRGRPPLSDHAHVAPSLTANNSTAPTTASPETPTDWLQFSSQGFGTISGTRDLVATLWDTDVEVTVPPQPQPQPQPLSRKSSRRARSQHSSADSVRTPVQPPPTAPPPATASPPATSKTTLITKVNLDEAFIDFWADSLLDPISKRWPRFVLCQLKPLPAAAAAAAAPVTPNPAWLVIEQRFVRPAPVSSVKDEAEATVPPARPRASSPRPESSRLSAAFSIASKKRFAFFAGGSGDPKSPKEKTPRLPQVGEFGDGVKEPGDAAGAMPAERPKEEAEVKDSVSGGAAPVARTAGATELAVVGAAAAAVVATREEPSQRSKVDGLPIKAVETTPFEPADVSAPKTDELVKDEPLHDATTQNGLTQDHHHDEEQCKPEPETAATQYSAGEDAAVILSVMSEPMKAETEPPVSEAGAETAQSDPASVPAAPYLSGISESSIAEAEATVPVLRVSAPEPSAVPVVEEETHAEEEDAALTVPAEPAIPDVPTSEEPKATDAPVTEPTPVPVESVPVQAPVPVPVLATIEEPVTEEIAESQEPEPEPGAKATAQGPPADEVPTPPAEPVLISEMPKAALPEGELGDSPSEPASVAPPATASEQPAATSADSEPIIVEDLPATTPEPVSANDTAPVIQPTPADEGQVADSADAVEATIVEEPVPVARGPTIEEDAHLTTISERDDANPEEPDGVEVAVPEPATELAEVVSDTTFPAPENADSAIAQAPPAVPTLGAEPDVEDTISINQPSESLPSQVTPQVDNPVNEEQPTVEETPTIGTTPAGDPATSNEDKTDDIPAEPAVAESTLVAELVLSGTTSSGNPPPEVPEVPVTEPEFQAIANDPESALPAVEPSSHVPETSASAVEEPVHPIEAEIPVEMPAPAADEASSTAAASTAKTNLVSVAQEPAPEKTIVLEVAETTVEASASAPAGSALACEEDAPAATDTAVANLEPAIEEPTPAHDQALAESPALVPEEPTPLPEQAAIGTTETPADTVLIPEDPTLVAETAVPPEIPPPEQADPDLSETPAPNEPAPVLEEDVLVVPEAPVDISTPLPDPAPTTENAACTAGEQVMQDSAANLSSEPTVIATQEELPDVETIAASEPASASNETAGAASASFEREPSLETNPEPEPEPSSSGDDSANAAA